ncbi:transposase [Streptomyces sp. MUM 136J]|uniref:transposase family protein n=1 Tax=Streptomyces sp. MUM 136J TaxID=2791992 RepID=UPI0035ABBFAC|nr:transposase [Streptomyces sp. MUM 136J]
MTDGTLIPTQRRTGEANRPNYSGKHRRHGLLVLALTDERGRLVWISAARPGRTHDITAARRDPRPGPPACCRPRCPGRPRLPRPGRRRGRSRGRPRLQGHPRPRAHPPPRRRPTGSWPPDASPLNAALPT